MPDRLGLARRPRFSPHPGVGSFAIGSEAIVDILPRLRRYAHAVAGSRESGDRYVRQFLEVFLASPDVLAGDGDVTTRCYALFHQVCVGLDAAGNSPAPAGRARTAIRLACLPYAAREILLLVHLEDFSLSKAAAIVGVSEPEAHARLLAAGNAFRRTVSCDHRSATGTEWPGNPEGVAPMAMSIVSDDGTDERRAEVLKH